MCPECLAVLGTLCPRLTPDKVDDILERVIRNGELLNADGITL
jgi:hypothetical protein